MSYPMKYVERNDAGMCPYCDYESKSTEETSEQDRNIVYITCPECDETYYYVIWHNIIRGQG